MKLIGLCAWFDEPVEFLTRMVKSAAASGVDTIVAVDGAYGMLPGARPTSDPKQPKALIAAARAAGVRLVLDQPSEVWETEVDKRNHLFRLGNAVAAWSHDWFLVMDADYEIKADPNLFLSSLFTVETPVAALLAYTPPGPNGEVTFGPPERTAFRALFRAQEITVERNHYTYVGEDGERLWGNGVEATLCKSTDLSHIVSLTHWTYYRPKQRNQRQYDYYRARDAARTERGTCFVCKKEQASMNVPKFIREEDDNVVAVLQEVCDDCYTPALKEAQRLAEEWNLEDMVAKQEAV